MSCCRFGDIQSLEQVAGFLFSHCTAVDLSSPWGLDAVRVTRLLISFSRGNLLLVLFFSFFFFVFAVYKLIPDFALSADPSLRHPFFSSHCRAVVPARLIRLLPFYSRLTRLALHDNRQPSNWSSNTYPIAPSSSLISLPLSLDNRIITSTVIEY